MTHKSIILINNDMINSITGRIATEDRVNFFLCKFFSYSLGILLEKVGRV